VSFFVILPLQAFHFVISYRGRCS